MYESAMSDSCYLAKEYESFAIWRTEKGWVVEHFDERRGRVTGDKCLVDLGKLNSASLLSLVDGKKVAEIVIDNFYNKGLLLREGELSR